MSASFPTSNRPPLPAPGGSSSRPVGARGEGFSAQRPHRPTALLGLIAGAGAAVIGIVVCAVVGLIGWYLSDAGTHGAPREGVAVGTRGWLVGHGAGFEVAGSPVTLVPLGITVLSAWLAWQAALRLGEAVWDHGPDEARRGDGERDFTILLATGGFFVGYLAVAVAALASVTSPSWEGSVGGVVRWSLLIGVLIAGTGVVVGSGRTGWWSDVVPAPLQDAFLGGWALLRAWLAVSLVVFALAMAFGISDASEIVKALGTSPAETVMLVLACLLVWPQAMLWSSAFLVGPGFQVGVGTSVAPAGVVLGPLPLLPIFGALPDDGAAPGWWGLHLAVPVMLAAVVMLRRQVRLRVTGWTHAAVAGLGAGVLTAVLLGAVTSLADGAVGPGRMTEFGVAGGEVFVAALPLLGLGAMLGALGGTWWVRRGGVSVEDEAQTEADDVELTTEVAAGGAEEVTGEVTPEVTGEVNEESHDSTPDAPVEPERPRP